MEQQRMLWGMVAIVGMCMPAVGLLIGLIRYRRYGEEVKKRVKEDYDRAQERGGIHSLYYKHQDKRIFQMTFGIPAVVSLLAGLVLMYLAFCNL